MTRRVFHLGQAFLPTGFAADVRVEVDGGTVVSVEAGASASGCTTLSGIAVPGMPNLHSHAFQRGMAGLAERRGPEAGPGSGDSFWTWRAVMYGFLGRLSPDDVEAIAAQAYIEMLESGLTVVGEFHYLHHGPDGRPYADPAEMAGRLVRAAAAVGIGLTILPAYYARGGFGDAPPGPGQRRFVTDPDGFGRLLERTRAHAAAWPGTVVGVAPHSLRAAPPDHLPAVVALAEGGPVHIHAAEQVREVEECLAATGRRPVEILLDLLPREGRCCLIHATHMTQAETAGLARSGMVAGLCPVTEASLGDGIFPGEAFLKAGGRFGIGTDSNVAIDAVGELRGLEYSQRLGGRARNVMTTMPGESTGTRLFAEALAGGAAALAQFMGAIAPGARADLVLLDADHPVFAAAGPETWLDAWLFCGSRELVRTVVAGGEIVVENGRHRDRERVASRYRAVMKRLRDA